ncbi:MAG: ATP-dependent DNA helicase RecG [Spirochaetes bacterium]|nr:ATP-dependent DNA helicase RecG [Spirochaetota bacterium]
MLNDSVQFIKGIGPKRAELLRAEAGIETIEDLLYYIPRRYLDRSSFRPIGDCAVNETVTVQGTIASVGVAGRKRRYLEVTIEDGTGVLSGIFFGGIFYLEKNFSVGDQVLFSGKVDFYRTRQMVHPDFDFLDADSKIQSIHAGRIVPLYPSTEKLKAGGFDSRGFRRAIRAVIDGHLDEAKEPLPGGLVEKYALLPLREALLSLHYPDSFEAAEKARRRLAFNELFFLQYYLAMARRRLQHDMRRQIKRVDAEAVRVFCDGLPFPLTGDQRRAIDEIMEGLGAPYPMNRMLQGDVGSGKTVVAMAASVMALSQGEQVAVMAPTEILAFQHYNSFRAMLGPSPAIALLTGSLPKKKKEEIYREAREGAADIVIGTHALIQLDVSFRKLGLIVIDEQHRFGVNQRARLRDKGESPDLLVMTATPIPRSLSLTLYGDLDVTLIREKPANRLPVKTMIFPESRLSGVHNSVAKYVAQKRQVYFVLPLIEESEKTDLKSAIEAYESLKKTFPDFAIELLHGKMKQKEKDDIMGRFKAGEVDILVSTTVIEVGVDVPNATVMVIEHAERFGLSQLHQLRGRVGRGAEQSYCVLLHPDDIPDDARRRLETLASTDDGFAIAEEDLKQRGAGEITGTRQHGYTDLEFSDLGRDLDLIVAARQEAGDIVAGMKDFAGSMGDLEREVTHLPLLEGIRSKRILGILS